jgi:membrane protease YdiL (CAAX protease family)
MTEVVLAALVAALAALIVHVRWQSVPLAGVVAVGAICFPAAEAVIDFAHVVKLIGQPTTLKSLTREQLLSIPRNTLENNLLVPVAGIAISWLLGGRPSVRPTIAAVDQSVRSWSRQIWVGVASVPLVVGAEAIALFLLAGPASFLQTADETALFANATPGIVLLLSITPAIAEEIYYRGFLQSVLERIGPVSAWAAIGIQAGLFAVAHGSYTSLSHLLGPLVFGLGMGYLRSTIGIGACVVAHAGVNLFYFAIDPGAGSILLLAATLVLVVLGLGALVHTWPLLKARLGAGPRIDKLRPLDS